MKRLAPLLFLAACHCTSAVEQTTAAPVEVWIAPSASEEPSAGGSASGSVQVAEVFSPIGGRIKAVSVQLGQRVKRGDTLATIDAPVAREAVGELRKAEAERVAAEHDYQRQKELCTHCCTQRDLEMAEDAYRRAKAELERARTRARILTAGMRSSRGFALRAPIDGEVLALHASSGQEVPDVPVGGNVAPLFVLRP